MSERKNVWAPGTQTDRQTEREKGTVRKKKKEKKKCSARTGLGRRAVIGPSETTSAEPVKGRGRGSRHARRKAQERQKGSPPSHAVESALRPGPPSLLACLFHATHQLCVCLCVCSHSFIHSTAFHSSSVLSHLHLHLHHLIPPFLLLPSPPPYPLPSPRILPRPQ